MITCDQHQYIFCKKNSCLYFTVFSNVGFGRTNHKAKLKFSIQEGLTDVRLLKTIYLNYSKEKYENFKVLFYNQLIEWFYLWLNNSVTHFDVAEKKLVLSEYRLKKG